MKVRQRTTCQVCRRKKISCDGKQPSCGQCLLRNIHCPGYPPDWIFISHCAPATNQIKAKDDVLILQSGVTKHPSRPSGILNWDIDELIAIIIRGYVPGTDVAAIESGASASTPRICGAWAEVLPDLVKTSNNPALTAAIKTFAFSILIGEPQQKIPMAAALEAYSIALRSVNDALQVPETSSLLELMAAVMCLLFAELVLPSSLESWAAHLEGLGELMQTCEPRFFASGIAHRLFVGARPALIVLRIQSRKSSFLAMEEWRTAPFSEIAPSAMQALMSEATAIPGLIEKIAQKPGESASTRILRDLETLLHQLESWERGFQSGSEAHLFWVDGDYVWFDSLTTANGLTHCWAFKVICLANIERILHSHPNLSPASQVPQAFISLETRRLSILICQSIKYLMQDKMKLFGPTSIILPLQTAYDTLKARGAGAETEDFDWCRNILESACQEKPFLSLFFRR